VGMGKSFQIWEPQAFIAFREQSRLDVVRQGLVLPKPTKPESAS